MTESLMDKFWEAGGIWGIICAFQFMAIVYLYKARESSQKEHIDTLKANLPLMEKLEATMSTALRVVSKSGGDR